MEKKINVIREKLSKEELLKIKKVKHLKKSDMVKLIVFNDYNFFDVEKVYINGEFKGYACIFLGYNGLDSTDASLEDINLLGLNEEEIAFFIDELSKLTYPITIDKVFYNKENIDSNYHEMLNSIGFSTVNHAR